MSLRLTGHACLVMSASRSRISRRHRPQPAQPLALTEMLCLRPLRPNRAAAQRAREVLMRKRASLLSEHVRKRRINLWLRLHTVVSF